MLRIEVQDTESNLILHCFGRIVRGDGLNYLRRAALAQNHKDLVIDLEGVSGVDAAALGLLAELQKRANASGYTFTLLNPAPPVAGVLAATNLNRVMRILKDAAWDPAFLAPKGSAATACAPE